MKTLEQHNSDRHAAHVARGWPSPNGIECPKCGKELLDSSPGTTLASHPPQKNIHCPVCDYRGYRLA